MYLFNRKGSFKMRNLQNLVVLGAMVFASACSSTTHTSSTPDDVYYTSGDPAPAPPPAVSHSSPSGSDYGRAQRTQYSNNSGYASTDVNQGNPNGNQGDPNGGSSSSQQYRDSSGNNVTNNYYNGGYDDYGYTSQLRRYYSPMAGYGYYDPYYTDPYFYGPSYGLGIGFGYGLGYGFGYSAFYNPFYPYYGFGLGYYGGYYSPFYGGYYNPYYYEYEGGLGYHYGPRGSISGNGRTVVPGPRGGIVANPVVNNRAVQSLPQSVRGVNNPTTVQSNGGVNSVPLRNSTVRSVPEGSQSVIRPQQSSGIISQKNSGGSTLPGRNSLIGTSVRGGEVSPVPPPVTRNGNISSANQSEKSNGGTVRPSMTPQQTVRPNGQATNSNTRSQTSNLKPQPNSGGAVRPNFQQQQRSQNQYSQPGNQSRNFNQQRSGNNARSNQSFDRARQYRESQPRMQPRMEQRQYSAPQRGGGGSAPSRSGGGGGGGGGGSRGSSHGGGGGRR
jgi:hypothetical protein